MKQLFHIKRGGAEHVQLVLSLSLGEKHGSFAITNTTGDELYELVYCLIEEPYVTGWTEHALADLFTAYPELGSSYQQVLIAYDNPKSIFIPSAFYKTEESPLLLAATYGILSGYHICQELIAEWQLYNTYAVPDEVYKWVQQKFPAATTIHQYSLDIKKMYAAGNEGHLLVDFRKDDFTLIIANNSKLLLAQRFPYSTPGDIVYYLLRACHRLTLSQREVNLHISGLIDRQSALYKELYQYFIHIEFREAGWNAGTEYPAHFFTSLNHLAQCAS